MCVLNFFSLTLYQIFSILKQMNDIDFNIEGENLTLHFSGNYLKKDLPDGFFSTLPQNIQKIQIDAKNLQKWDSSFLIFLEKIIHTADEKQIKVHFSNLPAGVSELLSLANAVPPAIAQNGLRKESFLTAFGGFGCALYQSFLRGANFTLGCLKTFLISIFKKMRMRPVDFLFALQECGPNALPIVILISFMVGLILAFVGAIQLQTFGAQVYVASLVTIGMTRIMGAIMVGIIMAGRTGSSFAATIGTMQVNEEIDALKTMGVNIGEFLVLPRLRALVISMPILTMLADFAGILGGAAVGIFALDIPSSEFFRYAYNAWFLKHFLVGLFHAFVFGFIIAISGCYFGIHCGRNADSVGKSTTSAVVYSIVWMIVATGLITFCLQRMGI